LHLLVTRLVVEAQVMALVGVEALRMALGGVEPLDDTTVIFILPLYLFGSGGAGWGIRIINKFIACFCHVSLSFAPSAYCESPFCPPPPSAMDLYLLSLGLQAALFRIRGHNLNPRSTGGHYFLSVIGFTHFLYTFLNFATE
jgi:hypothetical protein